MYLTHVHTHREMYVDIHIPPTKFMAFNILVGTRQLLASPDQVSTLRWKAQPHRLRKALILRPSGRWTAM